MKTEIKWAIYTRKSTESEDRQIQSIEDQIKYAKDIASRERLKVVEIIHEAKSAKKPYLREGFTRLISLIDSGKVNGVIVWKVDRLSRNPIESGTIQYYLQEKKLLCIKTGEKDYLPEDNAVIMSVEGGMANQYSRELSRNVKRGMRSKAEKGWFPNIPPLGYLNSKLRDKGNETIISDPERFQIVRKMWDLMLTGTYTPPKILEIATNEWGLVTPTRKKLGGRPLSISYMYKIFSNIFYTGNFLYKDESGERVLYQGNHEPMITMEEFDKVQVIMGKRGKPRPVSHEFPYTGFMNCRECGARITATIKEKFVKTTGKVETYTYYHCTKRKKGVKCKAKFVRLDILEQNVVKLIEQNQISPKFYKLGLEVLRDMHGLETGQREAIYESQQKAVAETQRKLDRALEFLLSGTISEEIYKTQKKELGTVLAKQKLKLSDTEQRAQNWTELTENVFHFAKSASLAFKNGDKQTKREIMMSLGWNHVIHERKLFIDLHSWFIKLKNGEKTLLPEIERLELSKNVEDKQYKRDFDSLNTRMCAGQDSNLRRPKSTRLQRVLVDHLSTDATELF